MNIFTFLGLIVGLSIIYNPIVDSANIVGLYTMDIKSHYLLVQNVLKELAKSGHNVTVFTGFKKSDLPKNYREVTLNLISLDGNLFIIPYYSQYH